VRQGERAEQWAQHIAERMRDAGLAVVLHCGGGSFKSQMKKADSSGALFAVILGDEELEANEVTFKFLRKEAQQVRVKPERLSEFMAAAMNGKD
jgi:histidyl-tRNA synthetase